MQVTTTGIDGDELERIRGALRSHDIEWTGSLSRHSRFLIATVYASEKFIAARRTSIPCVTPAWVYEGACTLDNWFEYEVCNQLKGKMVCSTKLNSQQNERVQSLATSKGATFVSTLDATCNLLVVADSKPGTRTVSSDKMRFARKHGIPTVSFSGYRLAFTYHSVANEKAPRHLSGLTCSEQDPIVLPYSHLLARSSLNPARATTILSPAPFAPDMSRLMNDVVAYVSPPSAVQTNTLLPALLRKSCVQVSDTITDATTHVLVAENHVPELIFPRAGLEFVSIVWLYECVEKKCRLGCKEFRIAVDYAPTLTFTGLPPELHAQLKEELVRAPLHYVLQDDLSLGKAPSTPSSSNLLAEVHASHNTTHLVTIRSGMLRSKMVKALSSCVENRSKRKLCELVDVEWVRRSLEAGKWLDYQHYRIPVPSIADFATSSARGGSPAPGSVSPVTFMPSPPPRPCPPAAVEQPGEAASQDKDKAEDEEGASQTTPNHTVVVHSPRDTLPAERRNSMTPVGQQPHWSGPPRARPATQGELAVESADGFGHTFDQMLMQLDENLRPSQYPPSGAPIGAAPMAVRTRDASALSPAMPRAEEGRATEAPRGSTVRPTEFTRYSLQAHLEEASNLPHMIPNAQWSDSLQAMESQTVFYMRGNHVTRSTADETIGSIVIEDETSTHISTSATSSPHRRCKDVAEKRFSASKHPVLFLVAGIYPRAEVESRLAPLAEAGATFSITTDVKACTHFIVENPLQTESLLCAIAAGKWVLAPSFLEESLEANAFVAEEPHEWDEARAKRAGLRRTISLLVQGCRLRRTAPVGPFAEWYVFLCCSTEGRYKSFSHVLECGGCENVIRKKPWELLEEGRLCLLYRHLEQEAHDLNPIVLTDDKMWSDEQLEEFAEVSGGLQVFKLDYITKCLCMENASSSDYRKLQCLGPRKRPRATDCDE